MHSWPQFFTEEKGLVMDVGWNDGCLGYAL